jgi:hypothetical protein
MSPYSQARSPGFSGVLPGVVQLFGETSLLQELFFQPPQQLIE